MGHSASGAGFKLPWSQKMFTFHFPGEKGFGGLLIDGGSLGHSCECFQVLSPLYPTNRGLNSIHYVKQASGPKQKKVTFP